jgi:DNA polymerase-3 subunit epsilon
MEREPDLELLIANALEPKKTYMALVGYEDRQKAKDAGFRWDGEQRRWLRKLRDYQVSELGFDVREVAA